MILTRSIALLALPAIILANAAIRGRVTEARVKNFGGLIGIHGSTAKKLLMLSGGEAVNFEQKLQLIEDTDLWSPKVISTMNDYQIKVVKVRGDFTWHDHKDTDEVFIVLEGRLVIDIQGQQSVVLNRGEMYVVPKGVVHKPYAAELCKILLIEPSGVVNTGDVDNDLTATEQLL